ncbi:hypothetical protein KIPB_005621 [Kipferlia bialata]|uniref:Uncharacterized protein n=1 Tax=Kipferlia bialata TaxID=797122 RepID=A0A9K3GJ72_9EUKA|nr:hypothetical protein KIPB_005621 [Kipferlia bialata]|eukprot:g5621.t1
MAATIAQFEALALTALTSGDPVERPKAEAEISRIFNSIGVSDQLNLIHDVLKQSQSEYSIFVAAQQLNRILAASPPSVDSAVQTCKVLVDLLDERGSVMPDMAVRVIIHSFCGFVKQYWFESFYFRDCFTSLHRLSEDKEPARILLGLRIMTAFVGEFSTRRRLPLVRNRKVIVSFRDTSLLSILKSGISILKNLSQGNLAGAAPDVRFKLTEGALALVSESLFFDFSGISTGTTDDAVPIEVPASWQKVICPPDMPTATGVAGSPTDSKGMEGVWREGVLW